VTPTETGDTVDIPGLERLLEKVSQHAHGILISSPWAGEGRKLGLKVKKELFERTMALLPEGLPLLVWISGKDEAETRRNLVALQKVTESTLHDRPIYWVDTPLLYHSNRGLPTLYEELFRLAERPFVVVNDPASVSQVRSSIKRKNIRTSILKEMAEMDFILALIFLGTLDRAYNYQKAVRRHASFRIYDGDEARFLEYPSLSGVVSAGANLVPDKWRAITESSLHLTEEEGDYPDSLKQLWEIGQFLHKLRDIYFPNPPAIIKSALADMGIFGGIPGLEDDDQDILEAKTDILRLVCE